MDFPIQPIVIDPNGVKRFARNDLVEHLLEHGGMDMNYLAGVKAPREHHVQFAQLIGYSVSGFGGLSYVRDQDVIRVDAAQLPDPRDAEIAELRARLNALRAALRDPMASLFEVHRDDLKVY